MNPAAELAHSALPVTRPFETPGVKIGAEVRKADWRAARVWNIEWTGRTILGDPLQHGYPAVPEFGEPRISPRWRPILASVIRCYTLRQEHPAFARLNIGGWRLCDERYRIQRLNCIRMPPPRAGFAQLRGLSLKVRMVA